MNYNFKYDSYSFGDILQELCVEFDCTADHEDDATVEEINLWSEGLKRDVKLSELNEKEQSEIEDKCQKIAYENAYDIWFEKKLGDADAAYDRYKEGD
jgi:hypothetical protein